MTRLMRMPTRLLTSLSLDCVHQLARHAGHARLKLPNTRPRIEEHNEILNNICGEIDAFKHHELMQQGKVQHLEKGSKLNIT